MQVILGEAHRTYETVLFVGVKMLVRFVLFPFKFSRNRRCYIADFAVLVVMKGRKGNDAKSHHSDQQCRYDISSPLVSHKRKTNQLIQNRIMHKILDL